MNIRQTTPMRYLFITVVLLSACLVQARAQATTLYKVVKKDGSVVYTDRPVDGAVEVDFAELNSAVMPGMKTDRPKSDTKTFTRKLPDFQLAMVSPADGATIRDNAGNLNVVGEMTPAGSGEFQLFLDGRLHETKATPVFSLTNLDRGEHSLQIKFKHNSGKILASTPTHTVFLHRASVLINSN